MQNSLNLTKVVCREWHGVKITRQDRDDRVRPRVSMRSAKDNSKHCRPTAENSTCAVLMFIAKRTCTL